MKRSRGRLMRAKMKGREGESGQRRERTKRGDWNKRRSCRVEHRDVTELIIGFCSDLAHSPHFFVGERICISPPRPISPFRLSQLTHESRLTQKGYIPNEVLGATTLPSTRRAFFILPPLVFRASTFPVFSSSLVRSKVTLPFFFYPRFRYLRLPKSGNWPSTILYFTYF